MTDKLISRLDSLLANTGDMALKRRARQIVLGIDPQPKDKILEVGCGDGYYLHIIDQLGIPLQLTGVDIDPAGLSAARRNLPDKKIKLIQADLMKKLPFEDKTFDKVIMSEVAEHLPDDVKGLSEVRRVLKPGGVLIVTVPNHNYPPFWDPVNWIMEHLFLTHVSTGFWSGLWSQHLRLYTTEEITLSINQAKFTIEEVKSTTFWSIPFAHNIINLGARMLHSGALPQASSQAINKFASPPHRPLPVEVYFRVVNFIDKLNDIWQPKTYGVGILVKCTNK